MTINKIIVIKSKNHLPYSELPHSHCGPTTLKQPPCRLANRQNVRGSVDSVKNKYKIQNEMTINKIIVIKSNKITYLILSMHIRFVGQQH